MSDRTNLPVVEAGEDWQALLALNLERRHGWSTRFRRDWRPARES